MGHSNAREAASTVPVRLGWLHASNAGLVAPIKSKLHDTSQYSIMQQSTNYTTAQYSTVVFSMVRLAQIAGLNIGFDRILQGRIKIVWACPGKSYGMTRLNIQDKCVAFA